MNFITQHRNLLILHFTVLIWGFTGVLGSLISTPALQLVWYRVLIAALTLVGYHLATRKSMVVPTADLLKFMAVGLLVGLHWVLFFQAIKVSTVSVTLVTLSSLTLFTAILEPLFYKRKLRSEEHTSELQSRENLVCLCLHSFPTRRSSDLFGHAQKYGRTYS